MTNKEREYINDLIEKSCCHELIQCAGNMLEQLHKLDLTASADDEIISLQQIRKVEHASRLLASDAKNRGQQHKKNAAINLLKQKICELEAYAGQQENHPINNLKIDLLNLSIEIIRAKNRNIVETSFQMFAEDVFELVEQHSDVSARSMLYEAERDIKNKVFRCMHKPNETQAA